MYEISSQFLILKSLNKNQQLAQTQTVVERLARKTLLEEEGWKRIPAVRRVFTRAGMKVTKIFMLFIHFF